MALTQVDAVVLRSFRFSEADRIVHVLTPDMGRVAAIAKGSRKMKSRLAAFLEPGTRVHLTLARGRGELFTVAGADLLSSNSGLVADTPRFLCAQQGIEAALRLSDDAGPSERAYRLLCRYLDELHVGGPLPAGPSSTRQAVWLAYLAKLLYVSGLMPELSRCTAGGESDGLVAFSAQAGGALCSACAVRHPDATAFGAADATLMRDLLGRPMAELRDLVPEAEAADRVAAACVAVLTAHLGVRLRTVAA